jgi:hypothetical protein
MMAGMRSSTNLISIFSPIGPMLGSAQSGLASGSCQKSAYTKMKKPADFYISGLLIL